MGTNRIGLLAAALLVVVPARAGDDACAEYRTALKQAAASERSFWEIFRERQAEAQLTARAPWKEVTRSMGGKGTCVDVEFDHAGFRSLYDTHAAIERDRVSAARELARKHGAASIGPLWADLLATCHSIDAAESVIVANTNDGGETWAATDQEPGIRRHGLQIRMDGLVEALASVPEAVAFAADEGWKEAGKADAKRSITRRVAVLDLLGIVGGPGGVAVAHEALGSKLSSLRIAAVECCLRCSPDARAPLLGVLQDRAAPVRRALLVGIRERGGDRPRWIPVLVDRLPETRGLERSLCLATLVALTGQRLGHDPAAWKAWCDPQRAAIEAGTFQRAEESGKAETAATTPTASFYGVPLAADGIVFVLDGTDAMLVPADYDVQRTRAYMDWWSGGQEWRKTDPRHKEVQDSQFARAVESLDAQTTFAVLVRTDQFDFKVLGDRKPLRGATGDVKKAVRFVESIPPGGYRCEILNLRFALDLAGLPAKGLDFPNASADTILFVGDGSLRGGPYMDPEAAALAFGRWNRFRRIALHTIRVCNAGKGSEEFLKRLAEVGGGTYRWQRKPP
jgi:hypothetical protein